MQKVTKTIIKCITLFIIYGLIYFIIECLWKQQISDYRMLMLGGFMGVFIGLINTLFHGIQVFFYNVL